MKKRIIIPTLLSAALFTGCVKDNESDSVVGLRNAVAEKNRAEAAHTNAKVEVEKANAAAALAEAKHKEALALEVAASTKVKEAEAKFKEAQAKQQEAIAKEKELTNALQAKKDELEIAKLTREAEVAAENHKKSLLDAQNAFKEAQAAGDAVEAKKAEAQAALALAQTKLYNAQLDQVEAKTNAYNTVFTKYQTAVAKVVELTGDIASKDIAIAGLEQGVLNAEEFKKREIARLDYAIESNEADIEKYKLYLTKTASELLTEKAKQELIASAADIAYLAEFNSSKLEDLEKAATRPNTTKASEIEVFQKYEKLYTKLNSPYYLYPAYIFFGATGNGTVDSKVINGVSYGYSRDLLSVTPSYDYNVANLTKDLNGQLRIQENYLVIYNDRIKSYEDATTPNGFAKLRTALDEAQKAYNEAVATNNASLIRVKKADLDTASYNYDLAVTGYEQFKRDKKSAESVITDLTAMKNLITAATTKTAFEKAIADYNKAVKAAAAQYYAERELYGKWEVEAAKVTVISRAIANASGKENLIKGINESIERWKKEKAELDGVQTASNLLAKAKNEKAKLEAEKVKAQSEANAYKAQLDALQK